MQIHKFTLGDTLVFNNPKFSVKILNIQGNQVRFGIDAPKNLPVDRLEIREHKKANPRP